MTRRQYYVALAVLAVTGLAGGVLGGWLFTTRTSDVVTAHEFRLVDSQGGVRGKLFVKEVVRKDGSPLRVGMLDLNSTNEHASAMSLDYGSLSFYLPFGEGAFASLGIEADDPLLCLADLSYGSIEFRVDKEDHANALFYDYSGETTTIPWRAP